MISSVDLVIEADFFFTLWGPVTAKKHNYYSLLRAITLHGVRSVAREPPTDLRYSIIRYDNGHLASYRGMAE